MEPIRNVNFMSIVFMTVSTVLSFLVPIAIIVYMGVKRKLNWKATLLGFLMFVVFVTILENIMHVLVLGTDITKSAIYKNIFLYAIYGGFAAGIFEETARFLCFRYLLKVHKEEPLNTGLSYGLGHGGFEAILIGGISSIGNLIMSIMLNKGLLHSVTSSMSGPQLESYNKGIDALVDTPSYMFLVTGGERMVALVLQIALTMFVFIAVRDRKWQYFVFAVLIHAGVDILAVLFQRDVIQNIILLEIIILITTVAVSFIAYKITIKKDIGTEEYQ